jgi:Mg2+/citrate symporter
MGFLTEKYVKDKSKKEWINLILNIVLILMLIFVGLMARGEFDSGAKFMLANVPAFCINATLYEETLEFYDIEKTQYTQSFHNLAQLPTENQH